MTARLQMAVCVCVLCMCTLLTLLTLLEGVVDLNQTVLSCFSLRCHLLDFPL